MKSFAIPTARHETPREVINDDNLPIFYHVVAVQMKNNLRFERLFQMVNILNIASSINILHTEHLFDMLNTSIGQGHDLHFFINGIVDFGLKLGYNPRETLIELGRFSVRCRDNERGTGFVNQDRVYFVDNGKVKRSLHSVFEALYHVVTEIIKSEFIVGSVRNITGIGLSSRH